jgi:photosystem II stability/assembly factor-like uncharacterized protein
MKNLFILLLILGIWIKTDAIGESKENLTWNNISGEIVKINTVWVDSQSPRVIFAGTDRGIFRTKNRGKVWQPVLLGTDKKVNFLYVDQRNKNLIYAGCSSGLFFSGNQGSSWQRIYQGDTDESANCLSFVKMNEEELYLGTGSGLLISQDNGKIWHRASGSLGSFSIRSIAQDRINRLIYLATPEGVYKFRPEEGAERIFVFYPAELEEDDEGSEDQINYISIDPSKLKHIYLATTRGVFKSQNQGESWSRLPDYGLLSKRVRLVMVSAGSTLWAVTESGVFVYNKPSPFSYEGDLQSKKGLGKDRWQELTLGLAMQDIRFLTIDSYGGIYVAGDKGLFVSQDYQEIIYAPTSVSKEPLIRQVQRAAIKYAEVVSPEQIAEHRRLARLKALLPEFSLDYDKTISTYNNSQFSRFSVGPMDWGVSLKWSLGDLIWSEQQRLIDSQVRLMIKLRQDILDEVTRLYFELRRLQAEFESSGKLAPEEKRRKELRLEELTAMLDGLTGGYFSKFILTE